MLQKSDIPFLTGLDLMLHSYSYCFNWQKILIDVSYDGLGIWIAVMSQVSIGYVDRSFTRSDTMLILGKDHQSILMLPDPIRIMIC